MIRVDGRPFYVRVSPLNDRNEYVCYFHEKYEWRGRTWGYRGVNKNRARLERGEIYEWFMTMVENNIPQDESGEQVLNEVVRQLEDDYSEVEAER